MIWMAISAQDWVSRGVTLSKRRRYVSVGKSVAADYPISGQVFDSPQASISRGGYPPHPSFWLLLGQLRADQPGEPDADDDRGLASPGPDQLATMGGAGQWSAWYRHRCVLPGGWGVGGSSQP
jgi:hypothetical protein